MRLAKAIDVTGDYAVTDKVADGVIQVSFATAEDASGFYHRTAYDKIRRALV
jgi:hypothetical protein